MTDASGRPRGLKHFVSGTGAAYLARAVAVITGIATLPIGIDAYGAGVYGVWITATSMTQYLTGGSLGMPLAVQTAVAAAPDRESAARVGAHGLRVSIAGALGLVGTGAALWLIAPGWTTALFGPEGRIAHVVMGVAVLLAGSAVLQPLQVYANVQAGRHKIVARYAYDGARTAGRFGALLLAANASDSLLVLAIASVAVEAVVAAVQAVHVTIAERIPLHRHVFDRSQRQDGLVASGMRFFALQVETTVIRNTDNLVISSVIGAAAVSVYAAPFRMVTMAMTIAESMQGPLWPAYGAAHRDGDWDWIAATHERVVAVVLTVGGAVWIGTTAFAEPVIALWLGPDFPVDPFVVFALGVYAFLSTWVAANAILLNALDATRSQVVAGAVEAVVNVGSSIALASVFGTAGVAAGTVIGAACVSVWYLPIDVRRQTEGRVVPDVRRLLASSGLTIPLSLLALFATLSLDGPTRYAVAAFAVVLHLAGSGAIFRNDFKTLLRGRIHP